MGKLFARQGRGASNGYNENWRNSPLWDSIEKKNENCSDSVKEELTEMTENEELKTEETLKEKQKRMFGSVY